MYRLVALYLIALIPAGGPFGDVTADGVDAGSGQIAVEFTIEAPPDATVVVHLIDPGDNQETFSLSDQSAGTYTGVATVEKANLIAVFELIETGGVSRLSSPLTLLDLGVDPAVLGYQEVGPAVAAPEPPLVSPENERLLWLAGAAALAALALVAVWAAGPSTKSGAGRPSIGDEEE